MSNTKDLLEWDDIVNYLHMLAGDNGSFKEHVVQENARRGFVSDGSYRGIAYTYHFDKGNDWFELIPVCSNKDEVCKIDNCIPVYVEGVKNALPITLEEAQVIYSALQGFMYEWEYSDHYLQTNSEPPKLL